MERRWLVVILAVAIGMPSWHPISVSDGAENYESVLVDTRLHPMPTSPTVIKTYPVEGSTDVPVSVSIVITFDLPMDTVTTFNSIATTPWFGFDPIWKNGDTELTLSPNLVLKSNTMYKITVTTAAMSKEGAYTQKPYEFAFWTKVVTDTRPPHVLWAIPANGDAVFEQPVRIRIRFSESMWKSVVSSVSIDRGTMSIPVWYPSNTTLGFEMGDLIPNTYRITVNGQKATDWVGNHLDGNGDGKPGDDFVFSFVFFGNATLPATINVNAIDTAHSTPIRDIEVTLTLNGDTLATIKSGDNYTVRFINLFPGDYDIMVRKADYPEMHAEAVIASGQVKNVTVYMTKQVDTILSIAFPIVIAICMVLAVIAALLVKREYYRRCPACGKYNRTRFDTCKRCGYDFVRGSVRSISTSFQKRMR